LPSTLGPLRRKARAARERVVYGSRWLVPAPPRGVPPCPPGWRTGPPDFVGVGAQKAGTSWWDALVHAHPDVHHAPSLPKELHFFGDYWRRPFTDADVARYHAMFPRPTGGRAGEWTPRYLSDFWVLPLLRRAAPEARLLVMLRDPVERYVSGLTFNLTHGAPPHPLVPHESMARGLYHQQLGAALEHYDRDRVLVLQYERCRRDPAAELDRTYRFLGLDASFVPPSLTERVNATTADKPAVPEDAIRALVTAYRADVARLARDFPEVDVTLWPRLADAGP
jgi:hypothetical protein